MSLKLKSLVLKEYEQMPTADSDFIQVATKQIQEEWKGKEGYMDYTWLISLTPGR